MIMCFPPSYVEDNVQSTREKDACLHDAIYVFMRITWMDNATNKDIFEQTGLPYKEHILIRTNLRWTGHLMRMLPDRLPKKVFYSQLSSVHRQRGHLRLLIKDTIK